MQDMSIKGVLFIIAVVLFYYVGTKHTVKLSPARTKKRLSACTLKNKVTYVLEKDNLKTYYLNKDSAISYYVQN